MKPPLPLQPHERDKLIKDNLGYVRALAVHVQRELGAQLDLDELVAYGTKGLVEAASRFDPARGVAFSTFAYYRIRGGIFDGLRETGWLGRTAHARFAASANAYLENQSEREPAPAPRATTEAAATEIAGHLADLTAIFLATLGADDPFPGRDAAQQDSSALLEAAQARRAVRAAVARLPDKERRLVELHYFEGLNLQTAGEQLGLSKSWASRLHARAIGLLARELDEHAPP